MSETKIKICAGTDMGLVRQNNEDNFVVCANLKESLWTLPQTDEFIDLGEYGALLVVADGMGGANAGEVASGLAIQMAKESFAPEQIEKVIDSEKDMLEYMKKVVKAADKSILNTSKNDNDTQGMGTTIVIAWVFKKKAYICWCGDSRCYVYNSNIGLTQLSKDHSFVQELVDKGELNATLANDHPLSNVITRCLGDEDKHAIPDTRIYDLHDGDVLLLCSDGLSGPCSDNDIMEVINEHKDNMPNCCNALLDAALDGGGYDNVTVGLCAIQIENEDPSDDLTRTIRSKAIGHKIAKTVIPLLLLIIAAAAVFIYTADSCKPIRQQIIKVTQKKATTHISCSLSLYC